jgi:hypothetical protein
MIDALGPIADRFLARASLKILVKLWGRILESSSQEENSRIYEIDPVAVGCR